MDLYFITGNKHKFEEVKLMIPEVQQLDIDLPEIQSLDPQEIIEAKLKSAFDHHTGAFFVEDVSFIIDGMNGLPGPMIKFFLKSIGREGLLELANTFGNKATVRATIGYASDKENIQYFEGIVKGTLVPQKAESDFGWDPIFQPLGQSKTFGEMTKEEKNEISHRKLAVEKLKKFLESQK